MRATAIVVLPCLLAACGDDGTTPGADAGGMDGVGGDTTSVECTGMADGTGCGDNQICLAQVCLNTRCGDGFVNAAAEEVCDDGNETPGDGCWGCSRWIQQLRRTWRSMPTVTHDNWRDSNASANLSLNIHQAGFQPRTNS